MCGRLANATVRSIHDRMPAVLEQADWPLWLGERRAPGRASAPSCRSDEVLRLWRISTRVNAPKNNDPTLLDRAIKSGQGGGPNPT